MSQSDGVVENDTIKNNSHMKMKTSHSTVNYVDSSPQLEPYKKPLLEERCHEVTERWQMRYNESRGQHLDVPHMLTVGTTIGRPLKKTQKGRPMIAPTKATL